MQFKDIGEPKQFKDKGEPKQFEDKGEPRQFKDKGEPKQLKIKENPGSSQLKENPEMEFKEFEPRFKSAKTRFKLSAGLNFETFDTILSGTNHI